MKIRTTFKATTTESAYIVPAGRKVILEDIGQGVYMVHQISDRTNPNEMVKMYPASIFLRTGEFAAAQD
jgi:hypothetical protein